MIPARWNGIAVALAVILAGVLSSGWVWPRLETWWSCTFPSRADAHNPVWGIACLASGYRYYVKPGGE